TPRSPARWPRPGTGASQRASAATCVAGGSSSTWASFGCHPALSSGRRRGGCEVGRNRRGCGGDRRLRGRPGRRRQREFRRRRRGRRIVVVDPVVGHAKTEWIEQPVFLFQLQARVVLEFERA